MDFMEALGVIKRFINLPVDVEYDGLIVKQLKASNTLDTNRSTKQTHIAITGKQMDIFPYLSPLNYLDCDHVDINDGIKKYFMLQVKFNIYKENVLSLSNKSGIYFDENIDSKVVNVSVWRRRDNKNLEQTQISSKSLDDNDFILFRKILHENDFLVILKRKEKLEYDCFGVRNTEEVAVLNSLNNEFLFLKTSTKINLDEKFILDSCDGQDLTENDLGNILKNMYNSSNEFGLANSVHMFGLLYAKYIKEDYNIKNIINMSGIPANYDREIPKMINVYKYLSKHGMIDQKSHKPKQEEANAKVKTGATNELFYGVPGSGKSYKIDQICNELEFVERVVFHPDYSNADFIGQIMPVLQDEDNKLKYEFIPGPFSNILKRAIEDPNNMYYLIIEEINRGNAAAIFGDIFQLLDRDENGKSKYCINNYYIADYVYGNKIEKIYLPSNLTIYATMNSSDQNVFTLDTAFQRRWIMKNVPNVFKGEQAGYLIGGSDIRWGAFATAVNNRLQESNIGLLSTEDKGLGAYFVNKAEIEDIEKFAEKVFKYLWDDAFKMNRADLFKENFKTLSDILNVCKNEDKGILEKILVKDVYDKMKLLNSEFSSEVTEV